MSAEASVLPIKRSRDYRAIIWGGLIAGAMDITAACINGAFYGRSPLWIFQSVASGLLGANSFKGGFSSAVLGGVIHFFIAFVWCSVFFIASRSLGLLTRRPIIFGVIYGVVVYFFMYGLVLRLTFHRNFLIPSKALAIGVLIHIICIGLPISLVVSRFSKSSSAQI